MPFLVPDLPEGILLNNLFQLPSGIWRANVRTPNTAYEFGNGDTPESAIAAALLRLNPRPVIQNRPRASASPLRSGRIKVSIESLGLDVLRTL